MNSRPGPAWHLPPTPQSTASFDGSQGFDQNGRSFQYEDGRLVRVGRLIVDLGAMLPDPERSPDVAYTW